MCALRRALNAEQTLQTPPCLMHHIRCALRGPSEKLPDLGIRVSIDAPPDERRVFRLGKRANRRHDRVELHPPMDHLIWQRGWRPHAHRVVVETRSPTLRLSTVLQRLVPREREQSRRNGYHAVFGLASERPNKSLLGDILRVFKTHLKAKFDIFYDACIPEPKYGPDIALIAPIEAAIHFLAQVRHSTFGPD